MALDSSRHIRIEWNCDRQNSDKMKLLPSDFGVHEIVTIRKQLCCPARGQKSAAMGARVKCSSMTEGRIMATLVAKNESVFIKIYLLVSPMLVVNSGTA